MSLFDTREAVLSQLFDLLGNLSGIQSVWRNRGDLTDAQRPAAVLLDGVEERTIDVLTRKTVVTPPVIMRLQPQIFVALQLRDGVDNQYLNGVLDPVGPELSAWRIKIYATIVNDPTIITLLTPNGQMMVSQIKTDMQTGSTIGALGAQLQMNFDFYYPLFPPR